GPAPHHHHRRRPLPAGGSGRGAGARRDRLHRSDVKGGDMAAVYRIFGAELSPYSGKVRSYFRYKRIPHERAVPRVLNTAEVRRAEGTARQAWTPSIERMEALYPDPSIHPADPTLAFLSALIEEYADEWGNKPMFHYRWFYEPDQESGAERIASSMNPEATGE